MFLRILMNDRWLPVNLPSGDYSDAYVEELTDKLKIRLAPLSHLENWEELQTIDLESDEDGWEATLYFSERVGKTEVFRFR